MNPPTSVQAWAFYEGRLLGAHHALISTYALEILVLYILNTFHAELSTPLEVGCCKSKSVETHVESSSWPQVDLRLNRMTPG